MAFSMHSHSGEFCSHGADTLEAIILRAMDRGMVIYALTEHMPREELSDLYPEELATHPTPSAALASLKPLFAAYLSTAARLRAKYADRITLLIGFECEPIHGDACLERVQKLFRPEDPRKSLSSPPSSAAPVIDFWVGSVHFVRGHPIDFDRVMYEEAVAAFHDAGQEGTLMTKSSVPVHDDAPYDRCAEARLWGEYFDAQYALITAGRGHGLRVVGHFDLIKLFSHDMGGPGWRKARDDHGDGREAQGPDTSLHTSEDKSSLATATKPDWTGVWHRVRRNLRAIVDADMLLEVNTSGLRKGLGEPYPSRAICEEFHTLGGRFTLSDDAHAVAQVGTCYEQAFEFLEDLGVKRLWYLDRLEGRRRRGDVEGREREGGGRHDDSNDCADLNYEVHEDGKGKFATEGEGPAAGVHTDTETLILRSTKVADVRAAFR